MFVIPGTTPDIGRKLTRGAAEQVARNWPVLLLDLAMARRVMACWERGESSLLQPSAQTVAG